MSDFDLDDLLNDSSEENDELLDSINDLDDFDESEEIIIGEVKPKRKNLFRRRK